MIEHPGMELQVLIKEKGLTQKAFAVILGKKVSEVNELLKGKRNITIQRDYLLHQTLGTPVKYRILKQVDYDYSLIYSSFGGESEESKENNGEKYFEKDEELEKENFIENNENFAENEQKIEQEIEQTIEKKSEQKSEQNSEPQIDLDTPKIDPELQNRMQIFRDF